tara:strand:- start:340 stop:1689 length:1350 start_codon:yes stop_codon:yes gene_type:complete
VAFVGFLDPFIDTHQEEIKMKKNVWSFLVVLLAAVFVGTTAVQAADISFGGDTIVRAEYVDKDEDLNAADWQVGQRIRLNTTVKSAGGVSTFTQLDAVQAWGSDVGPGLDTHGDHGSNAVGVHQANVSMPNFFGTGWNAKIGRQEIVFDGHRIFGHTGWNLNAVTHDAAVFVNPGMDLTYALSWMAEANEANTAEDKLAHVFRKGLSLAGGKTALYWVTVDDSSPSDAVLWHTAGIRQVGKAAGYDYRVEGYYQFGEVASPIAVGTLSTSQAADVEAYHFGGRIGKKVGDTKVTLWYEHNSGTDDAQANANEWGSFDTLYDTGHKFHGLIDKVAPGSKVDYLGLQDLAIKIVKPLAPGWTLKADLHQFWTAVDPGDNLTAWTGNTNESSKDDSDLGHELDLTLANKYSANTSVQFGYSYFDGTTTWLHMDSDTDNTESHWAYAQVKFAY